MIVSTISFIVLSLLAADTARMEDVVRSPQDYAGKSLDFPGATLSGNITRYDAAGVRKYYLNVSSRDRTFEPGFFLAPPDLADKLAGRMDPMKNYGVTLRCKVERIVINDVPQWHGIVTRVEFVGPDGKVTDTLSQGKK